MKVLVLKNFGSGLDCKRLVLYESLGLKNVGTCLDWKALEKNFMYVPHRLASANQFAIFESSRCLRFKSVYKFSHSPDQNSSRKYLFSR